MSTFKRLPRTFYARDTHVVAQALLGKLIVRRWRGKDLAARINDVEAYVGEDDLACHASRGRTARTATMYGEPGHAYVYLIYGMYHCLNVVTDKEDYPAAVLIRAVVPIDYLDASGAKPRSDAAASTTGGPGKLCRALHITKELNNEDLTTSRQLYIADDGWRVPKRMIATSPRIGVAYAGACALYPWRYYIK